MTQVSTENESSPSAINSYIQKALARKNAVVPANIESADPPKADPNSNPQLAQLTASLINTFEAKPKKDCSEENAGTKDENAGTKEEKLQLGASTSGEPSVSNAIEAKEEAAEIRVEEAKDNKHEELLSRPALNLKRSDLLHSVNQITTRTIQNIASALQPSQSVVNIVIAYVAVLQLIEKKKIATIPEYKILLEPCTKTFPNCMDALKNVDIIHQITYEIIGYVDIATKEELAKIRKIKDKYLAGWDMKPSAFSDRHYSARTLLQFLLCLCTYIDVSSLGRVMLAQTLETEASKKTPPKSAKRVDSPTRRLIEHKVLKIPEGKNRTPLSKTRKKEHEPATGEKSASKTSVRRVPTPNISQVYQSYHPHDDTRKKNDELIHSLIKV